MLTEIDKIILAFGYGLDSKRASQMRGRLRKLAKEAFGYGLTHYKQTGEMQFKRRFGVTLKYPYWKPKS